MHNSSQYFFRLLKTGFHCKEVNIKYLYHIDLSKCISTNCYFIAACEEVLLLFLDISHTSPRTNFLILVGKTNFSNALGRLDSLRFCLTWYLASWVALRSSVPSKHSGINFSNSSQYWSNKYIFFQMSKTRI